jgi:hypothetical protein
MPIIPALRRLTQYSKFKTSLNYISRKKKKERKKEKEEEEEK